MAPFAIVAIPSEDDYIWKISSEKIPHVTLLDLGNSLTNQSIVIDYLAHVADTTMCKFGLNVDHRGPLGPKDADVLFFSQKCDKMVLDARANLLKQKDIFLAYNSTEQYPEWTPHLTLGYPETPAKPDDRDYPGTHWVSFDRIALWTSEYDGPTFDLSEHTYGAVAMYNDMNRESAIEHFGVKGMHWGVRRGSNESGSSKSAKPKKVKPTSKDIYDARDRQIARANQLDAAADKYYLATTEKGKAKAEALVNKLGKEYATGPDAKLAVKSTKGEKWIAGVGYGLLATSVALTLGANAAAGHIGKR